MRVFSIIINKNYDSAQLPYFKSGLGVLGLQNLGKYFKALFTDQNVLVLVIKRLGTRHASV